jgi:hypothetical protein
MICFVRLSVRGDALVVGQHHAAAPLPERLHALVHGRPDAPASIQLDHGWRDRRASVTGRSVPSLAIPGNAKAG